MRILVVNTDYPEFLRALYARDSGLAARRYAEQAAVRAAEPFGLSGFYADNLRALGHEVVVVHANNEPLQRAWAREHGVALRDIRRGQLSLSARAVRKIAPRHALPHRWHEQVLAAQLKAVRPDVLFFLDIFSTDPRLLPGLRRLAGAIVGQHAATALPYPVRELDAYDLIVSSFQPTVDALRSGGVRSELLPLGFEPSILSAVPPAERVHDVVFAGSLFRGVHDSRIGVLSAVASCVGDALEIRTAQAQSLPHELRRLVRDEVWGAEMYRLLGRSKIVLNEHGLIAPYANNLRLFEATGMGAALVTDWKPNLAELFSDAEVASYRTPFEAADEVKRLLDDGRTRDAMARAGRTRTLTEHTWRNRIEKLVSLLDSTAPRRRGAAA